MARYAPDEGYVCDTCSAEDVPMLIFDDLGDSNYICAECFITKVNESVIYVSLNEADACEECGDAFEAGQKAYCHLCYEANWEAGQQDGYENAECDESHGCSDCGEYESYCTSCAVANEHVLAYECDECQSERKDGMKVLCKACFDKEANKVAEAQAAEPFEVRWDD